MERQKYISVKQNKQACLYFIKNIFQVSFVKNLLWGGLLTFSLSPFYIFPLLVLSLYYYMNAITKAASTKKALVANHIYATSFFFFSLSWIAISFMFRSSGTIINDILWLILGMFLVFILANTLALFWFFIPLVIRALKNVPGIVSWLVISLAFVISEIIRGLIFPWNLMAIAVSFNYILMQPAQVFGVYGVSFFVYFISLSGYFFRQLNIKTFINTLLIVGFMPFMVCAAYSYYLFTKKTETLAEINVRMVQPSISAKDKYNPNKFYENMEAITAATKVHDDEKPYDLLILGETALPFLLLQETEIAKSIFSNVPNKANIIIGSNHLATDGKLYNSFFIMDKDINVFAKYDKVRLVPFGEYIPKPFNYFAKNVKLYDKGEKVSILKASNMPSILPLICFEGVFPLFNMQESFSMIVNISIDSWYGRSHGIYQHAQLSKYRAIEAGSYMVRVNDVGVSFIADPFGRVEQEISFHYKGYKNHNLRIYKINNIYSKFFAKSQ